MLNQKEAVESAVSVTLPNKTRICSKVAYLSTETETGMPFLCGQDEKREVQVGALEDEMAQLLAEVLFSYLRRQDRKEAIDVQNDV